MRQIERNIDDLERSITSERTKINSRFGKDKISRSKEIYVGVKDFFLTKIPMYVLLNLSGNANFLSVSVFLRVHVPLLSVLMSQHIRSGTLILR